MGFYGNIKNTSQIQFQFDRIFESRTDMDQAVVEGNDRIFNGRFVLVKYDPDGSYFIGNTLYGYRNSANGKIYLDKDFTVPLIYITFTHVNEPIESEWNTYYYFDGKFYLKLPDREHFQANNQNYYTRNAGSTSVAESQYVGLNTLIRLRDELTGALTEIYYKCSGGTIGEPANWTVVLPDADFSKYMINFNKDKATYAEEFDPRGYDATVWEKIYSEGLGRFILIARLNGGLFPELELYPDAPSELPTAPYIDTLSSEALYRIHVPSMFGFQPKPVDSNLNPDVLTDQSAKVTVKRYNETTNEIESLQATSEVALYYNKDGGNKQYRSVDTDTLNQILIEPTGESGKIYYDREGNQVTKDIMELTVHMPMIGNMVADGYDLIYGYNSPADENGKYLRPTDITWIDGSASDAVKKNGTEVGGKTHNLETLAGTLNEFHDRLGQIIIKVEDSLPAPEAMSKDLIYEYNGSFYRRSEGSRITQITSDMYTYTRVANSTAQADIQAGETNKYVTYSAATIPSNATPVRATTYDSSQYYFLRNVAGPAYHRVDPRLVQYYQSTYYRKNGNDYIRDNNPTLPSDAAQTYYDIGSITEKHFTGEYKNDGTYFIKDGNKYKPALDEVPLINTTYYTIDDTVQYSGGQVIFYQPNVFFYKDIDGNYILDRASGMTNGRTYYVVTFDTSVTIYAQIDGNSVAAHPMKGEPVPIGINGGIDATMHTYPSGANYYYKDATGAYIPYSDLANMEENADRSLYTYPRVYYTINTTSYNSLFIKNVYYRYNEDTGDYTLSDTWINRFTDYYELKNISTLNPFYVPNKYYWNDNGVFRLATEDTKVHDDTTEDSPGYFTRTRIYVDSDDLNECPHGMEWPEAVAYIPPSLHLYYRTEQPSIKEMKGISNGEQSINGAILNLDKEFDFGNLETRDITTFRGCFNTLNDTLYKLKSFVPGEVLFVNIFGQVESISLTDLKAKLNSV